MSLLTGWTRVPLGDLIDAIEAGKNLRCEERPPEPHERGIVKISAVTWGKFNPAEAKTSPPDVHLPAETLIRDGDLLISRANTLELVGATVVVEQAPGNLHLSDKVLRIKTTQDMALWLNQYLRSVDGRGEIEKRATGNQLSMRNIGQDAIRQIEVPIPPLPEQRRIISKLDSLSARTKTARDELARIPLLIEHYKQAILEKAFTGALTAGWRDKWKNLESAKELVARTPPPIQSRGGRQATRNVIEGIAAISVSNPGTPLPEGWEWVPLRRIARQETGHTPSRSKPEWWGGDVRWIGIKDANLHHGRVIHDTIQKTNELGLAHSSARLLPAGTVCLSRTASVGYVTVMGCEMATSQDFATWTCTDALLPKYLMYALMSEGEDIGRFGEGSTHTTIYFPEIRAFHVKLAPLREQEEIVSRIESAFAQIERLAQEAHQASHLLGHLDKSVLTKAFRGELVPQDPNDEPAEELLGRIRATRETEAGKRRGRRQKVAARSNSRAER